VANKNRDVPELCGTRSCQSASGRDGEHAEDLLPFGAKRSDKFEIADKLEIAAAGFLTVAMAGVISVSQWLTAPGTRGAIASEAPVSMVRCHCPVLDG
jgi:hypothetical protein